MDGEGPPEAISVCSDGALSPFSSAPQSLFQRTSRQSDSPTPIRCCDGALSGRGGYKLLALFKIGDFLGRARFMLLIILQTEPSNLNGRTTRRCFPPRFLERDDSLRLIGCEPFFELPAGALVFRALLGAGFDRDLE
jgi:hypothetical protein